jgi:hypothetical protein
VKIEGQATRAWLYHPLLSTENEYLLFVSEAVALCALAL